MMLLLRGTHGIAMLMLALAACAPPQPTRVELGLRDTAGTQSVLRATDGSERSVFVRRLDGNIMDVFQADVFGPSDLVVLTGTAGGEDQCKVLVFSADGTRLAERRVEGESPFPQHPLLARAPGEHRRQLQHPTAGQVRTFEYANKRFIAVGTGGLWFPSSVEILEVAYPGRLVPRAILWNRGSLSYFDVADGRLALIGLANGFRESGSTRYPVGVALFDLRAALMQSAGTTPLIGTVPSRSTAGEHCTAWFLLPEEHGFGYAQILPVEVHGDVVRAPLERGIEYTLNGATGTVEVRASPDYDAEYRERRSHEPGLPPLDAHLEELRSRVRVIRSP